jgi:hypothetical protein
MSAEQIISIEFFNLHVKTYITSFTVGGRLQFFRHERALVWGNPVFHELGDSFLT